MYLCGKLFSKEEHTCKKYSREENNWTDIQNFPYINEHGQAESANGNLYVFGGSGGKRNVVKYNSEKDSWTVLPAKIPFNFTRGCSTVIGDCRVFLMDLSASFARFVVFDAISETFQEPSFIDTRTNNKRCSAVMGKPNSTIGIMVAVERKNTFFSHEDPPFSISPKTTYNTNHLYTAPILGRVSNNTMVLGGLEGREIFQNSQFWEDMNDMHIPYFNIIGYRRSTQVPKSWFG